MSNATSVFLTKTKLFWGDFCVCFFVCFYDSFHRSLVDWSDLETGENNLSLQSGAVIFLPVESETGLFFFFSFFLFLFFFNRKHSSLFE